MMVSFGDLVRPKRKRVPPPMHSKKTTLLVVFRELLTLYNMLTHKLARDDDNNTVAYY